MKLKIVVLDSCVNINEVLQFISENATSPNGLHESLRLAQDFANQTDTEIDILSNSVLVFRPKSLPIFRSSLDELASIVDNMHGIN